MRRALTYGVLPLLLLVAGIGWLLRGGGEPGPVELAGQGAHYAVVVALEPKTGPVLARVHVSPVVTAEVSLFAVMPHMGHTTPEIVACGDRAGQYVVRGDLFTMPGVWEIGVRVRGSAGAEVIKVNALVGE